MTAMTHPPRNPRILVLLNPGRTSRQYIIGIARAAERRGILGATCELGEVWQQIAGAGAATHAVRAKLARDMQSMLAQRRITHVLGYVHNGVFDFGLSPGEGGRPCSVFGASGVRHILLWTDHPNWAVGGSALDPRASHVLASLMHTHIVKSESAASELHRIAGWPNVMGMPMAEDYDAVKPDRSARIIHDAVVILSDAFPVPHVLEPYLEENDPDPALLMHAVRPAAVRAWTAFISGAGAVPDLRDALLALANDWLDAKAARPLDSFFRIGSTLVAQHTEALGWLNADPQRWYAGIAALNAVTAWRRAFWLAWLGRRVNLGVYGSPAERLGLPAQPGQEVWVPYEQQASIYARGACAININAAHDEEGMTHKPFQIVASAVACIHHASRSLDKSFSPGAEIIEFQRGPELLDAVRAFAADPARRDRLAAAAYERARRDHTWDHRLLAMLNADAHTSRECPTPQRTVESAA